MFKGFKKHLIRIFLQVIPISIGVYLGFLLSIYGESIKRSKQCSALLENIILEINANEKKIKSTVEYHKMLRDSSLYYLDNPINYKNARYFSGVQTNTLVSSTYNTLVQTGLNSDLELNQNLALDELYASQESYNDFAKIIISGLVNINFDETRSSYKKVAIFLSISMGNLTKIEKDLLEEYKVIKELLKTRKRRIYEN